LDEPAVVLRPTPLQREIELRTKTRRISGFLRSHAGTMMRSWAAYRQNVPVLKGLMSKLNSILRRYKSRRNEIGLFYLAPRMIHSRCFTVKTHLGSNSGFLKELWKKKMQERKIRGDNDQGISTVVVLSTARESVIVGTL
ncbi:hypothetical protein BAE44_0009878, partial [Dichanthelium oligosanthes]